MTYNPQGIEQKQQKMLLSAIGHVRQGAIQFQETITSSGFIYELPAYRPFFDKLEKALNYIDTCQGFSEKDAQLQAHMEVLKAGASPLVWQLQMESSKNLHEVDDAHNHAWAIEMHDLKNKVNIINGFMGVMHSSIETLMQGPVKTRGGMSV
jgi:hypothetical protein